MMGQADTELAQEHESLMQFVYMAPVGLLQAQSDGEIVMMNPVAAQLMMPMAPDGALSNLFAALQSIAPDLKHRLDNFAAPQGMVCDGLHLPAPAAGGGPPRLLSISLLKLDALRVMALIQDVTWQAQRERLLKQQQAWLHAILTGVSDYAMVPLDTAGQVVEWNESIGRVTGFRADAVVGRPFAVFYPVDGITPERVHDRLAEADCSGWSVDDGWRLRADGSRFWGSALIAPLRLLDSHGARLPMPAVATPGESAYCLILRDMSDQHDTAEQARHAAVCDHLTGIGNRRALFESAELELRRLRQRPRPLSLLLFDADHFKRINDEHGHPAGDAVLRHIARTLTAACRQVDVVARIGGEEFAVLMMSTHAHAAQRVAEHVCRAMAGSAVMTDAGEVRCTLSAGVATLEDGQTSFDELFKQADRALYAAKAGGRNRVCCAATALTASPAAAAASAAAAA